MRNKIFVGTNDLGLWILASDWLYYSPINTWWFDSIELQSVSKAGKRVSSIGIGFLLLKIVYKCIYSLWGTVPAINDEVQMSLEYWMIETSVVNKCDSKVLFWYISKCRIINRRRCSAKLPVIFRTLKIFLFLRLYRPPFITYMAACFDW